MPILLRGETLGGFLARPGRLRRLVYRLHLELRARRRSFPEPEWYLLPHLVDRSRAAVDVGAHLGVYAGRLAALTPRVHCIEPVPHLATRLAQNLPPTAVIHCGAASDRRGVTELAIPVFGRGVADYAAASLAPRSSPRAERVEVISCPLLLLDDIVPDPVGFMKLDVEGHELAALRGAERILERDRPVLLVESVPFLSPEGPEALFRLLNPLGYRGLFCWEGRLLTQEAFDPAIHQPVVGGSLAPGAVWNFIFLPGSASRR